MAYMLSSTKKTSKCWEMSLICVGTGWQRLNASCNGIITVDSESVRKKYLVKSKQGIKTFYMELYVLIVDVLQKLLILI